MKKQCVAVVGAGLAGLSAAYFLRGNACVTVFEKDNRIGGRVLTSNCPRGEHGAEFILGRKDEPFVNNLLSQLGIRRSPEIVDWPGYLYQGRFAEGDPREAARKLLSSPAARCVENVWQESKSEKAWNRVEGRFVPWLEERIKCDMESARFIEMLLAGETCAPPNHISASYGLGCLNSLSGSWYRIAGGSRQLAEALLAKSNSTVRLGCSIARVRKLKRGVDLSWREGGNRGAQIFDGAILAVPRFQLLLVNQKGGHFHSYVSVLLAYRFLPHLKANPLFDLRRGLYTDGPLNYLQVTRSGFSTYVLRTLMPNADNKALWSEGRLIAYCVLELQRVMNRADRYFLASVERWEDGLPCGGRKDGRGFREVQPGIVLAGDAFAEWPSMEGALQSGKSAAEHLQRTLGEAWVKTAKSNSCVRVIMDERSLRR